MEKDQRSFHKLVCALNPTFMPQNSFLCKCIRWPLFSYLHHNSQSWIIFVHLTQLLVFEAAFCIMTTFITKKMSQPRPPVAYDVHLRRRSCLGGPAFYSRLPPRCEGLPPRTSQAAGVLALLVKISMPDSSWAERLGLNLQLDKHPSEVMMERRKITKSVSCFVCTMQFKDGIWYLSIWIDSKLVSTDSS